MEKAELLKGMRLFRLKDEQNTFANFVPRPQIVNFTIPVADWTSDNEKYFADINISGITANDDAEIDFDSLSQNVVSTAKIFNYGDSMTDKIRIYAEEIPTQEISGTAKLTKGVTT